MEKRSEPSDHSRLGGAVAIIVGGLSLATAVFADEIGLSGGGVGIGWKQLIAAIIGVIVILIGIALLARPGAWSITEE